MSAAEWASAGYLLAGLILGAVAWHDMTSPKEVESMSREVPEMRMLPSRIASAVYHGVLALVVALVVVAWPFFAAHLAITKVNDWRKS